MNRAVHILLLIVFGACCTCLVAISKGRPEKVTVTIYPAAVGQQLVRLSVPFPRGFVSDGQGVVVSTGEMQIDAALRPLTYHPSPDTSARWVRCALVTFPFTFASTEPTQFSLMTIPAKGQDATSFRATITVEDSTLTIAYHDGPTLKARVVVPERNSQAEPKTEIIESNQFFRWQRFTYPDSLWPLIIEVRADGLGSITMVAHLQNNETDFGYAPRFGWEIETTNESAHLQVNGQNMAAKDATIEHDFSTGQPCQLLFHGDSLKVYHPAATLKRKGCVQLECQDNGRLIYRYLRSAGDDKVPMQRAAWRRAEIVIAPAAQAPLTVTLRYPHAVKFDWQLWDELYGIGPPLKLESHPPLQKLLDFHHEAIVHSMATGDDWGNITQYIDSSDAGGVFGMNRLNHCPPIFFEAMRSCDDRLLDCALAWCDNFYDLSIWWGPYRTGGTRYNNLFAMGKSPPDSNHNFMWRSNDAVTFCTKGYDSFLIAYELTGDPRMLEALQAQVAYATKFVHTNDGECRNIGDVLDFVRLYRYTGKLDYLNQALRLFRELRNKLMDDHLFSQSGSPIVPQPRFIDDDSVGSMYPFAKPYIIGYALSGLPQLAAHAPDEARLRDVIQAVADFQAESQDPLGGWRYPHPRSSRLLTGQAMEHAWQLTRADEFLGTSKAHLDAIERVLRQRYWTWQKTRTIFDALQGWEISTGKISKQKEIYELYHYPQERGFERDYQEGQPVLGSCSPEGLIYLPEILNFYLKHRPASRILRPPHDGEPLYQVLARLQPESENDVQIWKPGLVGLIFDHIDLTKPMRQCEVPVLDLAQLEPVNRNDWAMSCQGAIKAPVTGKVTFSAEADDGIRLEIGNHIVIDGWGVGEQRFGKILMRKGEKYQIRLSYFQDGGPAIMRLYWCRPGQPKTLIPAEALYHNDQDEFDVRRTFEQAVTSIEKVILKVPNPSPDQLPTLKVWQRDKELLVAVTFPNLGDFTCDSWCYESPVEFMEARSLDWGRVELRHRYKDHPEIYLLTTVTPEPGAVEFVARLQADSSRITDIPDDVPAPNLCWQLKRAPDFASAPDPYPDFIKRCFIFTEKDLTFLDKTVRCKIPVRPADDPYNNPPWVQMYVGVWQKVPQAGSDSWAAYSPTQYTATVIGAVSRDARYLAAIANDSAPMICQAWHDCMHNNAAWKPKSAPLLQRRWRVKIYVMENDPQALLRRVAQDFPDVQDQPAFKNIQPEPRNDWRRKVYQTQGVEDYLPTFYARLLDRLTFPQSWLSGKYTGFAEWRKQAREVVRQCWLPPPPQAPFDPEVIAEQDRGSYVAKKVVLDISTDSRVLGYLLMPKGKGPFPAVLLLHDHGARFDIGKEKVIRPWDVPDEKLQSALEWVDRLYGGRFIGDELAKRGYVCFCTDALNWSDRGGAGYKGQQALASNLFHMGASLAGMIAHEDVRAAEFLTSLPQVDKNRIAAMGLSMGSYRTWQLAAMSDRIAAGVAICWMATVKGLMSQGNNQTGGQSSYTMLHPGLFNYLDYPDVASLACPKPMLFFNGENDHLFPVPAVKEAYAKMRQVWQSQGASDRLVTKLWPVGHEFTVPMQEEAFEWLDQQMQQRH